MKASTDEKRPGGKPPLPPKPVTTKEKAAAIAHLTEEEKRNARCCFTGHRPEKLRRPVDDIKVDLENEILRAIKEGCTTFITGMAYGTDIWAGNIVVRLKDRFPDLKLIAAVPFPQFANGWTAEWKERYAALRGKADYVKVIAQEYNPAAYQRRNEWMVDHSKRVIAVYSGSPGGTRNTIRYAQKNRIPVKYLNG